MKERIKTVKKVISKGLGPQKIILGNGASNLADTVDLVQEAIKCGCQTFLIAPPSFFKNVQEEGVITFYREIIQRVNDRNLRIILYHFPKYTCVPITHKIIETLRTEFPQTVVGIKDSEGDLSFTQAVLSSFDDFKIFVGNERDITLAVHAGVSGSICGIGNLYPELMCSLYEQGKEGKILENPEEFDNNLSGFERSPFYPSF